MTKKPFILIVEDDEWLAQHYVRVLDEEGMHTEFVPHALAAIDAVDRRLPDVIVLDLLLPGPNAFTLLHELRSHSDLAAIPVILCTTAAEQISEDEVRVYGARRILDKAAMQPSDLAAAVKKVLL